MASSAQMQQDLVPSANTGTLQVTCPVCYGEFEPSEVLSAGCAHYACKECWAGYLKAYIDDAAKVLHLRCIGEKCTVKTPLHVLEAVATDEQKAALRSYEQREAVSSNSHASWCTLPDCAFIAYVPQPPRHPTCARVLNWLCCVTRLCWSHRHLRSYFWLVQRRRPFRRCMHRSVQKCTAMCCVAGTDIVTLRAPHRHVRVQPAGCGVQVRATLLLHVQRGGAPAGGLPDGQRMERQELRRERELDMDHREYQALPQVCAPDPEESGLHAYDVLAVPARVLLALQERLEQAWGNHRRLLCVQQVRPHASCT